MGSGRGDEELEVAGESGENPVGLAARRDPHGSRSGVGIGFGGGGGIQNGDLEGMDGVDRECEGYVAGRVYGFESGWSESRHFQVTLLAQLSNNFRR